jgi:hypothetical protein
MARTIKPFRIESDGRRLAAGAIQASSQDDLAGPRHRRARSLVASYRGVQLGTALVTATRIPVPMEAN